MQFKCIRGGGRWREILQKTLVSPGGRPGWPPDGPTPPSNSPKMAPIPPLEARRVPGGRAEMAPRWSRRGPRRAKFRPRGPGSRQFLKGRKKFGPSCYQAKKNHAQAYILRCCLRDFIFHLKNTHQQTKTHTQRHTHKSVAILAQAISAGELKHTHTRTHTSP